MTEIEKQTGYQEFIDNLNPGTKHLLFVRAQGVNEVIFSADLGLNEIIFVIEQTTSLLSEHLDEKERLPVALHLAAVLHRLFSSSETKDECTCAGVTQCKQCASS